MLSVIILSDGRENAVVSTLAALVPGAAAGLIREVLLIDNAANPAMARVADIAGCSYVVASGGRGEALAEGARKARAPWLMVVPPGAVLEPGWIDETAHFIQSVGTGGTPRAAVFRVAPSPYAAPSWRTRLRAIGQWLGFASADRGLVIARDHYDKLGGSCADGAPEVSLLRRLGRRATIQLHSRALRA